MNWVEWYNTRYNSLVPISRNKTNGYLSFDINDLIKLPMFRVASDFYKDAVISGYPIIEADNDQLAQWVADNKRHIEKVLKESVQEWSIKGYGVICVHSDGSITKINPTNYFRFGNLIDSDRLVGHVITYPYYVDSANHYQVNSPQPPNRIRIMKFAPQEGLNTVQTFQFTGQSIGNPIDSPSDAGIVDILTFGDNDSFYGPLQSLATALLSRLTNNQRTLNIDDDPILQIPIHLTAGKTTEELRRELEVKNPIITHAPDSGEGGSSATYIGKATEMANKINLQQIFVDYFYFISGIPPTAYGIGVGKNQSGIALERTQDRASARVREVQEDIKSKMPNFLKQLPGIPAGNLSVYWNDAPFENRQAKIVSITNLVTANIITPQEARHMLGFEELQQT